MKDYGGYQVGTIMVEDLTEDGAKRELCKAIDLIERLDVFAEISKERVEKWRCSNVSEKYRKKR